MTASSELPLASPTQGGETSAPRITRYAQDAEAAQRRTAIEVVDFLHAHMPLHDVQEILGLIRQVGFDAVGLILDERSTVPRR